MSQQNLMENIQTNFSRKSSYQNKLDALLPQAPAPSSALARLSHSLPLPAHLIILSASIMVSVVTATISHLVDAPLHESWNLFTTIVHSGLKSLMANNCPQGRHSMSFVRATTGYLSVPAFIVGADISQALVMINKSHILSNDIRQLVGLEQQTDVPTLCRTLPGEWVISKSLDQSKLADTPIVLYLHGGAHIFMSPRSHRSITAGISKSANARVFALDYRLAPESIFPSAIEDVMAAYLALLNNDRYGSNIPNHVNGNSKIFIAGDSSGGCLSLQFLIACRELNIPQPAGLILISPFLDHGCDSDSWRRNWDSDYMSLDYKGILWALSCYSGSLSLTNPFVSPLYNNLDSLCPILIQAGGAEVLTDDAIRVYHRLQNADAAAGRKCRHALEIYADMFHVFHTFPMAPLRDVAMQRISAFMQSAVQVDMSEKLLVEGVAIANDFVPSIPEIDHEDEGIASSSSTSVLSSTAIGTPTKCIGTTFQLVAQRSTGVTCVDVSMEKVEKICRGF